MYYDALIAKWATLTGTTAQKLAAINALTVPGPNIDVPVSTVVGTLILSGAYQTLQTFSQATGNANPVHDTALGYAKLFMTMISLPNAPRFQMSVPADYLVIKGMMDAILAQETAGPGTTGFTQAVHDQLLALCSTTVTWCKANGYPEAQNGGGGITEVDLLNAGGLT